MTIQDEINAGASGVTLTGNHYITEPISISKAFKILFWLIAALFTTVVQAGSVPSDLGGETGKRMVQVAERAQAGFWEMKGVYGSSGTLNLWLAWNGKGCVGKGSLWAFHRPAPKASALASLALSGVTETDIVEIYARAYPHNFRQVFMDEIKMKVGAKWFTGARLASIDSDIVLCDESRAKQ